MKGNTDDQEAVLLAKLRDRFAQAWNATKPPRVEDFLSTVPESFRLTVARELIVIDWERRSSANLLVAIDDYARRFPELSEQLQQLWDSRPEVVRTRRDFSTWNSSGQHQHTETATPSVFQAVAADVTQMEETQAEPVSETVSRFGPFQILEEIGRGGMGIVYRACDRRTGELVALKTLNPARRSSLLYFKNEFRALAGISHPNVAQLYELFSDGPQWFFTMELIEGVSFLEAIRGEESLTGRIRRLRETLPQLVDAIEVIHRSGRLHRDLKPSNVMVSESDRVVILDFGLAAELDADGVHEAAHSQLMGTPAYMAPEQGSTRSLTAAADWYSVGVMLYQALTDRQPFTGRLTEVLRQKETTPACPPRELNSAIPEPLNQLCVSLLHSDPELRGGGAQILSALRATVLDLPEAERSAPPTAVSPNLAFVGRNSELNELRQALRRVKEGTLSLVWLRGRSGFGKSRLINQFLQHEDVRSERRSLVLSGRCYERESIPFKAFDPLIDQLTRELGRLTPEILEAVLPVDVAALSRVFPVLCEVPQIAAASQKRRAIPDLQELRQRAFVALRELLARLASRRCLILCLDDLQWCDPDSVPLFESLFFDVSSPNCLVIGAYREEDEASSLALKSLLHLQPRFVGGSDRIAKAQLTLGPLTPDESIALASQMLSADASDESTLALQIATEGQGSPFFISVLATAQQDGPVETMSILRLEDVLAQRIQALPASCRQLLEIVAVAGQPIRETAALQASECSTPQSVLIPLWTQGLLRQLNRAGRDCLETYHDKIRETIFKGLTADRLRECHAKLAKFLEEDGTCDPETLARHFRGADNRPRAAQLFAAAAQQSTHALAFDEATRLFREALALHSPNDPGLVELELSLADALANAGRGAEAAQQYLRCCQFVPAERRIELERLAARQWLISGHMDEGIQTMRSVLAQQGIHYPKTPLGALASFLWQRALLIWRGTRFPVRQNSQASPKLLSEIDTCWAIGTGLSVVDCIRGADFHARCLLKAAKAGEPQRLCRALAMDAVHSAGSGSCSPQHVEKLHTIAANLAQSIGTPEADGYIKLTRGMIEFLKGKWTVARTPCEEAENIFRNQCAGLSWEFTTAQTFLVFLLYYLGDLAELKRRVPALCREAEDKGDLYALTNHLSFGGILLDITAGQPDAGFAKVEELSRGWSSCGFHVQHQNLLGSRIQLLQYVGRSEEAWAECLRMRRLLKESQLERIHVIRIFNSLVMGRVAVSLHEDRQTPKSLADARELSRKLKRERFEWASACASLVDAGIAGAIADQPAAIRHLQLAIEKLNACEMHLFGNMAKLRLGQLTDKQTGQTREAEAIHWLVSQGVRDPHQLADVFAPGFRRLVSGRPR